MIENSLSHPVKPPSQNQPRFDHEFLERRFRQHHEWQRTQAAADASAIIHEVASVLDLARQVRAGKGPHKVIRRLR